MHGCTDVCPHGRWIHECMDAWMHDDAWIHGCNGCMHAWNGGILECVSVCAACSCELRCHRIDVSDVDRRIAGSGKQACIVYMYWHRYYAQGLLVINPSLPGWNCTIKPPVTGSASLITCIVICLSETMYCYILPLMSRKRNLSSRSTHQPHTRRGKSKSKINNERLS